MRIAFIGPFGMKPKSTMRVRALPMAQALARRGHKVALFLPPFHTLAAEGKKWIEEDVCIENVPVSRIPLLGYLITTFRLVKRALSWQPEIIHCFKPKAYSGLALWLLWWWWKPAPRPIRLVLDTDDWEGWGGWNELESYSFWQKHFFAWQERWGLTHGDAITVASRALQTISWSMGIKPNKVFYIPNGATIRDGHEALALERRTHTSNQIPPRILLYTRFFEFDVDRIVNLLKMVREQVPETQLLVVGKGLFGEEERLISTATRAGLCDAVEYVGWVPIEELPIHFSACQCAIYPFNDTLINRTKCAVKLNDLMAAGVPIVAESVGQIRETIEHGRSGLLVPTGDDMAIVSAIVRLLQDPELRATITRGALSKMTGDLNWDRLVKDVEKAYSC